jgi:Flp pilus assembly protein TadG
VLSFQSRRPGRFQGAQSTIEFALAAPIFFFIFFSIINGGLLLFSRNAIQHAADVGAAEIAAQGNSGNADQLAMQEMNGAGLNNAVLTKVTAITVQKEDQVGTASSQTLNPDTTGCGGSPCEMQYTYTGVTGAAPSGYTCTGTCTWPSTSRIVSQTVGLGGNPDFALVTVKYTFATIGHFTTFQLTAKVVLRLEPQSL